MAIPSINLSGYRQRNWAEKSIKYAISLAICLFSAFFVAVVIVIFSQHITEENQQHTAQLSQLTQQNRQLSMQIAPLQAENPQSNIESIRLEELLKRFDLIKNLPISGIESIQIYSDNGTKLKLTGKVQKQSDFEKLEIYLKQQEGNLQIDYFQTDENKIIIFGVSL